MDQQSMCKQMTDVLIELWVLQSKRHDMMMTEQYLRPLNYVQANELWQFKNISNCSCINHKEFDIK